MSLNPILKIGVLVYNHGPYIQQTIESLVGQKTEFPYKIVVFEDFSSDNSRAILSSLKEKYPEKLDLIFNEKNLGDFYNLRNNFKNLNSKYISLIDGDDFWTNDNKIQNMVHFLEQNPEFVGTAHNVELQFDDGRSPELLQKKIFDRDIHTIEDLISGYCYHHPSSLIFRNVLNGVLPKSYYHPLAGDWFLSMLFAQNGSIKYYNQVWSVYRIHKKGFWSKHSELNKVMLNTDAMFYYNQLLEFKYDKLFARNFYSAYGILKILPRKFSSIKLFMKYIVLMCTYDIKYNPFRYIRTVFRPLFDFIARNSNVKLR